MWNELSKIQIYEDRYQFLNKHQKKLLAIKMIELDIHDSVKAYFKGSPPFNMANVITLGEFMNLNWDFKVSYQKLICCKIDQSKYFANKTLRRYDPAFVLIKKFLALNGFTGEDWIMLKRRDEVHGLGGFQRKKNLLIEVKKIEPEKIGSVFSTTDTAELLKQDLCNFMRVLHSESRAYKDLHFSLQEHNLVSHNNPLMVEDILKIDKTSFRPIKEGSRSVLITFLKIYQKFKEYKFTEKDGPFMSLKFVT